MVLLRTAGWLNRAPSLPGCCPLRTNEECKVYTRKNTGFLCECQGYGLERSKILRLPVLSLPGSLNYHSQQEHRPSGGCDSWDGAAGTKVALENKDRDMVAVSVHGFLLPRGTQLPALGSPGLQTGDPPLIVSPSSIKPSLGLHSVIFKALGPANP